MTESRINPNGCRHTTMIALPKKGNTEVLPYVYHITCIAIANGIIANTRYTTIL